MEQKGGLPLDLISKKELLALTGISYGQLYRWKRQGLIPEEWFIKRSAYTGQETFFPREQILSRIRTIQGAKDDFSLDELSKLLSPQADPGFCPADKLGNIGEIDPALLPLIDLVAQKDSYEFYEVVVFAAVSQARAALELDGEDSVKLLTTALSAARDFPSLPDSRMILFREGDSGPIRLLLCNSGASIVLRDVTVLGEWEVGSIAGNLKLKYQKGRF